MFFAPDPVLRQGACVGIEPKEADRIFFGTNNSYMRAKAICMTCPVQEACLEKAVAEEDPAHRYGVFGGMTARQRTRVYGGVDAEGAWPEAG